MKNFTSIFATTNKKLSIKFISSMALLFFCFVNGFSQQNVFSRSESGTDLWWNDNSANRPWYYETWNSNESRPDIWPIPTRNNVFIGHNNNTTMNVNSAFFQLRTLTIQASASSNRTYGAIGGGGISLTVGYYKLVGSGNQTFNVPIGVDAGTVDFSAADGTTIFSNNFFINSNTARFTGAGNITVSGVAQGNSGRVLKEGTGTLTLSGVNTYTGTTTISNGVLELGNNDRIANSSNFILNGGTFRTGATSGFSDVVGNLTLSGNSTIALGSGSHTITFASSNSNSWTANTTLNITGWTGTAGNSGTAGKIFIGSNTSGLTPGQLAQIQFNGYAAGAELLSTGELVPKCNITSISIHPSTSDDSTCLNGSAFSELTVNAVGTGLTYQWQSSATTGGTYTNIANATSSYYVPLNSQVGTLYYRCVITNGCGVQTTSNATGARTVNSILTASVSITASATTICSGASVTFTATPTNGGTTTSYQWYVGSTAVGTNSATFTSSALTNGNSVSVVMTSNATPCLTGSPATSNSIVMTVSNNISWTGAVSNLWSNGANWSCGSVPSGTSNITISSGTPTLDTNFTVGSTGSLTLDGDASLIINSTASLTVAGSANFNARPVTFKSDVSGTAEFGPLTGTLSGATNVTTERYFSAKRAFRFTSSAVTTTTPIRANWQEGVNNSNTTFSNNQNPNPGFGTHITGAGGSANGFDPTVSNASSLFTYNNSTPAWTAVTNTNQNTLTAGVPYRINVRGDRSIDMSLTNPTATATVLRATGTLATGTVTTSNLSSTSAAYNFIGNPYQAPVDIKMVIAGSTNISNTFYYVWDPTLGIRGAYSTVDLSTANGNPNVGSSNKFLQPGQACFVRTAANGAASITFQESYKDLSGSNISLFRNSNQSTSATSNIKLRLYDSNSLALNQSPLDGSLVFFDDSYNNGVDQNDGAKFTNPDEMFSTFNNGALISIEKRIQPTTSDIIPIRISQYRGTNYTIVAQGENLNGIPAYLHDQFLQTYTEIPQSGSVNYPYTVVTTNTQTTATDRFRIVYSNPLLSTANNEWKNFTLYPNPSKQGNFNIILGQPLENGKVTIYNTLGVKVYNQDLENTIENSITPNQSMSTGVYYVEIQNGSERSIKKLIIE
jgi:autotransporter-associated beta strand protein